ncbi:MAG: hypothetical protein AAFN94_02680 [Pseudomonadota bacterium]
MTAIYEATGPQALAMAARTVDGQRWLVRGVQRFFGVALLLAAGLLWLQPGALTTPDVLLFKLAVTCVFALAGAGLMRAGQPEKLVEVEIDPADKELRLVRVAGHVSRVIDTVAFEDFGKVEQRGEILRIWHRDGGLVAEVPLTHPDHRAVLMAALA